MTLRILLATLALLACGLAAAEPARAQVPNIPADAPIRIYTVQPGDSAWSIAEAFYGRGDYYPIIYRYNDFSDKGPFLPEPGQTLRLPMLTGGPEAYVGSLHRDVRARPPRSVDWLRAKEKMNLWRLYRVATGEASAARIVFEDDSDLKMRERALLVIYGATATTARTSGGAARRIEVEEGTVVAGLAALDAARGASPEARAAPIEVATPSGTALVKGSVIQVQVEAALTALSAIAGEATLTAQNETVHVPEAYGTIVRKGRRPEQPRPLPVGPAWTEGTPQAAIVLVQPGAAPQGTHQLSWAAADGADAYRIEVAADASFKEVVYDVIVDASVEGLRLEALDLGRWWVRVASRTREGLEGAPNNAQRVSVIQLASSRPVSPGDGGSLRATGFTRLLLPDELASTYAFVVRAGPHVDAADPAFAGLLSAVDLFKAGLHQVAIVDRADPEGAAQTLSVTIEPVTPALSELPSVWPSEESPPMALAFTLRDPDDRPTQLPGVTATASHVGSLPVTVHGHGEDTRYAVALPPAPAGADPIALELAWAGGSLYAATIPAPPPPARPPRPVADLAPLAHALTRGGHLPLFRGIDESRVAIQSSLSTGHAASSDYAELSLAGQWVIPDLDLALDLTFVGQSIRTRGPDLEDIHSDTSGDLWLGGRMAFALDPALTLIPWARGLASLGRGHGPRHFGGEVGLLARWAPDPAVFFDFAQGLFGSWAPGTSRVDAGHELRATTTVMGSWRAARWAELNLHWQLHLPLGASGDREGRGGEVWQSAGLGFGLLPAAGLRVGAAFGLGIGEASRAALGAFTGRLILEFTFEGSGP